MTNIFIRKAGLVSFAVFGFLLSLSPSLFAKKALFSEWIVEIKHPEDSLDRYQMSDVAGIILDGDHFFMPSTKASFDRRLTSTGEVTWSASLSAPSQASWTLDHDELFGGDTKGNLYCLDAKTGKQKWKTGAKGVFYSRPLVGEKQIWVMTSVGTLQSYKRDTGEWLWEQTDPNPQTLSLWSFQGPVFFRNTIVAGFPSAVLKAFEPESGKPIWTESFAVLPGGSDSFNDLKSVSAGSDLLFASSFSGDLRVWQAVEASKKLLWQKRLSLYAPVAIDTDGTIYASVRDGSFQAIDSKTGYLHWKYELPRGIGTQASFSNDYVWLGTSVGEVYVFSKSGDLVAKSNEFQSAIWNPPVIISDTEALILTSQALLRKMHISEIGPNPGSMRWPLF